MPQQALQERMNALQAASIKGPQAGAFRFLCMDAQELGQTINLADAKHQRKLNGFLNDVSFLVLDNMSTLCSLVQRLKMRPYPSLGLRSRDLLWRR